MTSRLPRPVVESVRVGKIFGIRAGVQPHRFLALWAIAVGDRVFVRTWSDKPTGWFRAFAKDRRGVLQIPSGREVPIRVRAARGDRLLDAIDAAYAAKYNTRASMKYVRGFATPRRRVKTLELLRR
ncbi:MAG TPA: DUF2255 family protein [Vicinamibacterales bacterium]|jgi:hypothetical protein|nr:DUF2255 family protein [Vicinamibacterales bacterium]